MKKFFLTILSFEKYIEWWAAKKGPGIVKVWGGVGHKISRVGWGGVMQRWSGGESYRDGVGHAVKQHKNFSPRNQDWPNQNHSWKGYKNLSFDIKIIIIIILLLQLYYILNYIKKILPDVPCIKILMAWLLC